MTLTNLTPDALKTQAKRLRETLAQAGTPFSHSAALEAVAKQHGYRDWNTAQASVRQRPADTPRWQIGQDVQGRYLGHRFNARIKAATQNTGGFWNLTLVFDEPVDVVNTSAFSNFRKQVSCIVNAQGVTHERTSDGTPHVVLFDS